MSQHVHVALVRVKYVCFCISSPIASSLEATQQMNDILLDFCGDGEVILLGDFNLPSLSWNTPDPASHVSATDRQVYEVFTSLGLTQWAKEPTYSRSSNILGLVLSTEHGRVAVVQAFPPLPGCDHCPVLCSYSCRQNYSYPG